MTKSRVSGLWVLSLAMLLCGIGANAVRAGVNVTTYHNDNMRSGWNQAETTLTQANVSGGTFGMLSATSLDDQVDAQPLIVTGLSIAGGIHDVVYVATESNSIYALDANTGAVLLHVNFGSPVPYTALPGQCGNNGPNVGINSTPVIDLTSQTLYVVTYTYESSNPIFRIHTLDLSTLTDKVTPVVITASAKLTNKTTYQFNPAVSRQRAALLLASGNVYAAFASFCDIAADQSRGWVLGWKTGTLAPLAANELTNKLATDLDTFFLTSIWMSGYGPAADSSGNIYFVTGNTDYSGTAYNSVTNIAESVGSLNSALTSVNGVFTPSNHSTLDQEDADFGSGGVMLIPGATKTKGGRGLGYGADLVNRRTGGLAVAAGKDGNLYLLNTASLKTSIASYGIGGCWCGPSYFVGHDAVGRVVASGGVNIGIWQVTTSPTARLTLQNSSADVDDGQDPGFFTSISSNGTTSGTAVIWAVGRPTDSSPAHIKLYAFNADNGGTLFSADAGSWPNTGGNSNTVPTAANGKVYVASDQTLAIFGLGAAAPVALPPVAYVDMRPKLAPGSHEIYGTVRSVSGNTIVIAKRTGEVVVIDATEAASKFRYAEPSVGHALIARGTYGERGVFKADTIMHAKNNPRIWFADR